MGQYLIDDALSKRAASPQQRAAILFDQLSRMWTELYYRSAMIELDHWVMEQVAAGTPPSGSKISARYLELMRSFNGHGSGGLAVEDIYSREWITESTLFSTHHQNSFAASAAAAAMMIEGLEKGDQQILGKMRNIRGRRLEFSNDFLLSMGIDLSTTTPYEALIRRMQTKMDQIERELDEMKRQRQT
jgi:oligoendopeptidase F